MSPSIIGRRLTLVTSVVIALLTGCAERSTLPPEPSAGNWLPVLPIAPDALRPPAPPSATSEQQQNEIDELIALQNSRTVEAETSIRFWNAGASLRWNEIARDLVAKYRTPLPLASRVYALLSVAQYDALVAAWNNKYAFNRRPPNKRAPLLRPLLAVVEDPSYPSEHATVAAVSAAVLTHLYPDEVQFLERKVVEHEESRLVAGVSSRSDISAGDSLGRDVANLVIQRARNDGADRVSTGSVPTGAGRWISAANAVPVTPQWGDVTPWLMPSPAQFRAAPPPAYGSPAFVAALAEVKKISDTRTPEQARLAALWADGAGSYAPSGRWNKIAADLIVKYRLNEIRAARVFALLNMALMDAGIACWETKYFYWVIRPSQADRSITTPAGLPNHPSYPSAHSCFSGASAEVLGLLFPGESAWLRAKAEEASLSRTYGGIHYRFDREAGMAQGRAVAQLVTHRARTDGSP